MDLSLNNLQSLWDKSRQFHVLFNEEVSNDFEKFMQLFINWGPSGVTSNGIFYVVDDFVGVFYMTEMKPGVDAQVHFSFFDRRLRGRLELMRAMVRYCFEEYKFHRLSTEIPLYIKHFSLDFLEALGFKYEGRRRQATQYKGEWYDRKLYGILKSEALNGSTD
jgi:RimJ/RimL family protein N-acetyltransferase